MKTEEEKLEHRRANSSELVAHHPRAVGPELLLAAEKPTKQPTLAERIVWSVENELSDRSGLDWRALDRDTYDELRATLIRQVQTLLDNEARKGVRIVIPETEIVASFKK